MNEAANLAGDVRFWVGGVAVVLGLGLLLIGQLGQLRLPDIYTRIHASGLGDGAGAGLLLVGLAIVAPSAALSARLLLLALLICSLAPILAHLGASAAHGGGVAPTQAGAGRGNKKGRAQ